tara:strand:- start:9 stop:713 length:705 start_codon:yes stop_codon:yes gene_type:complete
MAKDLPYFKFFCSEWNDGDITLEDYNVQGVFINVCSYYWSKECNLESKMLFKRFKNVKEDINILITEGHIKDVDGFIEINFLDEQLGERGKLSKQNSKNAKKRWVEKREAERLLCERNANASVPQCEEGTENMQYREEKKREEKKRKENRLLEFETFWKTYAKPEGKKKASDKFLILPKKDVDKILLVVKDYVSSTPDKKYRKNPTTWLNGEHWNDEITSVKKVSYSGRQTLNF